MKEFIYNDNVKNIEFKTSDENFNITKRKRAKRQKREKAKEKKILGRKRNDIKNGIESKHNKNAEDNIIKKIKTKLIDNLISFINNLFEKHLDKEEIKQYIRKTIKQGYKLRENKSKEIIKQLDYNNIVNKTSRKDNLQFLHMSLRQFLSQNISSKLTTFLPDTNKIIIDEIIKNHSENGNINFIFNLKFSDWLDVFLKKKEFSDLEEFNNNIDVDMNVEVGDLLRSIYDTEKKDNNNFFACFFSCFILYLYNFERIFKIKKERTRKKRNNS